MRELLSSHHARCLAGVVLAAALATTVIDLNYQWYASAHFRGTREDLTRLFGLVSGTMGLLAADVAGIRKPPHSAEVWPARNSAYPAPGAGSGISVRRLPARSACGRSSE